MSNLVPDGWGSITIGDIGKIVTGFTPSTKSPEYWDGDIPFVSPADFDGQVYVKKTGRMLTQLGVGKARLLPKNSILVTCIGSLGGIVMLSRESVTNQQINAVVASDHEYAKYHFYNILFNIDELKKNAGTTTLPIINKSTFEKINLLKAPLPEQKKIAAILTSVDDVIEKTQAQIDKLKDLKTGMMQELLTRGVGVDGKPHTEFKDSPVGRIPKGWEVAPISALCSHIVDCVNKTAPVVDYKTPYKMIRTTNVRHGRVDTENVRSVTKETYELWVRRLVPQKGDLIFTREAPVGECGILQDERGVFLGQRTMMYRADETKTSSHFLMYSLMSEYGKKQLDDFSGGSTVPHMRVPDCGKILVKILPKTEQDLIVRSLKSVDAAITSKEAKLQKVNDTKKALMQDLLTGKKRVKVDS
ncbi:restriction endonuclease subunit S [Vibrio sp.]|uniref:restriction endonuclease subunit S n=1 Tax=Vibrio sp. TaxID=678 RepID=UPI003F6AD416